VEDEELLCEMDEPEDEEDVAARECEDDDREVSDQAVLDELDGVLEDKNEVDEHDIPALTRDDINVGRFSIFKVCFGEDCCFLC
jgi:hypothetical protein